MIVPDLAPYNPGSVEHATHNTVAIGWLGGTRDFEVAEPNSDFLRQLILFCKVKVHQTRGFHVCQLCPEPVNGPIPIDHEKPTTWLGTAEIRVIGDGKVYAAPDLIYHYVLEHHYGPPFEFVTAVISGPKPDSPKFRDLLRWYETQNDP